MTVDLETVFAVRLSEAMSLRDRYLDGARSGRRPMCRQY
jgi:hypothetical protein